MKKRFVLAIDSATEEQDRELLEFLRQRGVTWWHWIANLWLVVDPKGELTASALVDALGDIYPDVNTIVLELGKDRDSWAGFGPRAKFFTWVKKEWKR